MNKNHCKQENIRLGTHGEDYGSWMSNPVFYVIGGIGVLAAALAVLSFYVLHVAVLGVLFMQEPPLFNVEQFYVHAHTQAITPRKDSKSKVIVYLERKCLFGEETYRHICYTEMRLAGANIKANRRTKD